MAYITPVGLLGSTHVRHIDLEHHVELVAKNTGEIAEYQRRAESLACSAAAETLAAMSDLSEQGSIANDLLGELNVRVEGLDEVLSALRAEAVEAIRHQTAVIQRGLDQVVAQMDRQRQVLETIAAELAAPYETRVRELIDEAKRALKAGAGPRPAT